MKLTIVDKVRYLRRVPTLSGVSTEVLADMATLATLEEVDDGVELFEAGAPAAAFYVIVDGAIDSFREGRKVGTSTAGDVVGILAVLDGQPRAVSAVTSSDAVLLRIGAEDFLDLCDQHAALARGVIRQLASEVRARLREAFYRPRS